MDSFETLEREIHRFETERQAMGGPTCAFDGGRARYTEHPNDVANATLESRFGANVRTGLDAEGIGSTSTDGAIYGLLRGPSIRRRPRTRP